MIWFGYHVLFNSSSSLPLCYICLGAKLNQYIYSGLYCAMQCFRFDSKKYFWVHGSANETLVCISLNQFHLLYLDFYKWKAVYSWENYSLDPMYSKLDLQHKQSVLFMITPLIVLNLPETTFMLEYNMIS